MNINQKYIDLDKKTKEVLEVVRCPRCESKTLEVVVAGKNLVPPSHNNGILTECTKCDWTMLERL